MWQTVPALFSTSLATRLQTRSWKPPPPLSLSPHLVLKHTRTMFQFSRVEILLIVCRWAERGEVHAILSTFFCLLEKQTQGHFLGTYASLPQSPSIILSLFTQQFVNFQVDYKWKVGASDSNELLRCRGVFCQIVYNVFRGFCLEQSKCNISPLTFPPQPHNFRTVLSIAPAEMCVTQ